MKPYPKRSRFFALRFVRLMVKVCLAQELGQDCFALLAVVSHTEDARSYRSAVTFWNDHLVPICGFTNVKALERARGKTVQAGWLEYEPGSRGRPARYFVVIPEQFIGLDDAPTDEGELGQMGDVICRESVVNSSLERRSSVQPSSLSLSLSLNPNTPLTPQGGADAGPAPPAENESQSIDDFLSAWNSAAAAAGLVRCRAADAALRRQWRRRLREEGWAAGWRPALARCAASPICTGRTRIQFRANARWFLRAGVVSDLLDGVYDRGAAPVPVKTREQLDREALESAARRKEEQERLQRERAASPPKSLSEAFARPRRGNGGGR